MSDLAHVAKLVHIPVFGQHVDAVDPGPTTGWTPPEALLEAGAAGTLINHSERKVAWEEMAQSVPRCRRLGLRSEEHTSELQSRSDIVCRLLLEKKKKNT